MDCIFCKIASKEVPAEIVFENNSLVIFKDIHPKAKIHLLVVPKRHIATVNDLIEGDGELIADLVFAAKNVARDLGFAESGYRLRFNVGAGGGQEVFHIHLHILAD